MLMTGEKTLDHFKVETSKTNTLIDNYMMDKYYLLKVLNVIKCSNYLLKVFIEYPLLKNHFVREA